MKMKIVYADEVGVVVEEVDVYGVSFVDNVAYFNDRKIETKYIHQIVLE